VGSNLHRPGVYKITNLKNGRLYVGGSVDIAKRIWAHKTTLKRNENKNKPMQEDFNICGMSAFDFSVIEFVDDKSKVIEREQHWIVTLNAATNGYNMAPNAGPVTGIKRSDETKVRLSASLKGRPMLPEVREKLRIANIGRKHSAEEIEKRASALRGRHISDAHKAALSAAMKGKKKSPEHVEKMRGLRPTEESKEKNRQAHLGMKASSETRKKISESNMGRVQSKLTISRMIETRKERGLVKAVIATCLQTGVEKRFESAMDAERSGFLSQSIYKVCHGQMKKHAGHSWRFDEACYQKSKTAGEAA
jgi:group I intron endonuclease